MVAAQYQRYRKIYQAKIPIISPDRGQGVLLPPLRHVLDVLVPDELELLHGVLRGGGLAQPHLGRQHQTVSCLVLELLHQLPAQEEVFLIQGSSRVWDIG